MEYLAQITKPVFPPETVCPLQKLTTAIAVLHLQSNGLTSERGVFSSSYIRQVSVSLPSGTR